MTNVGVIIKLPNAECKDCRAAMQRVAEHCPVHETIESMDDVHMQIFDKADLAAVA